MTSVHDRPVTSRRGHSGRAILTAAHTRTLPSRDALRTMGAAMSRKDHETITHSVSLPPVTPHQTTTDLVIAEDRGLREVVLPRGHRPVARGAQRLVVRRERAAAVCRRAVAPAHREVAVAVEADARVVVLAPRAQRGARRRADGRRDVPAVVVVRARREEMAFRKPGQNRSTAARGCEKRPGRKDESLDRPR